MARCPQNLCHPSLAPPLERVPLGHGGKVLPAQGAPGEGGSPAVPASISGAGSPSTVLEWFLWNERIFQTQEQPPEGPVSSSASSLCSLVPWPGRHEGLPPLCFPPSAALWVGSLRVPWEPPFSSTLHSVSWATLVPSLLPQLSSPAFTQASCPPSPGGCSPTPHAGQGTSCHRHPKAAVPRHTSVLDCSPSLHLQPWLSRTPHGDTQCGPASSTPQPETPETRVMEPQKRAGPYGSQSPTSCSIQDKRWLERAWETAQGHKARNGQRRTWTPR